MYAKKYQTVQNCTENLYTIVQNWTFVFFGAIILLPLKKYEL